MASLWKRLQVVVPGFAVGVGLSVLFATWVLTKLAVAPDPAMLMILFGPVAGPFAEPLSTTEFSLLRMCVWGGVLLPLIALHPCWPRRETGVVSGLTIAFWFLLGFVYTYATLQ